MALTYKVATANCGNGVPGSLFTDRIAELMENTDLLLLHCQETHLADTVTSLHAALHENDLTSSSPGLMVTHTKLDVLFSNSTGMATVVITAPGISVEKVGHLVSRRTDSPLPVNSAGNKGGLVTKFRVTKAIEGEASETYDIDAISAHLESFEASKRLVDWQLLFSRYHQPITNFEELLEHIPDAITLGMDANTRNYNAEQGPWDEEGTMECFALLQARLGSSLASGTADASTYKTLQDNSTVTSSKRLGRVNFGRLDVIGDLNTTTGLGEAAESQLREVGDEDNIGLDGNDSERDHHVLIGSRQTLNAGVGGFVKVKTFLAKTLQALSPELSQHIVALEDNADNKEQMVNIYNTFIANPDSVLNLLLQVETQKLAQIEQLELSEGETPQSHYKTSYIKALTLDVATTPQSIAQLLSTALKIEQLALQYQAMSLNNAEKEKVNQLTGQAMRDLTEVFTGENPDKQTQLDTLLTQLTCLLDCNHELHDYQQHLRDNGSPENKLTIVNNLIANLGGAAADESPQITARHDNFKAAFEQASADNDNIIDTHRDTKFWHRIARIVKGFFKSEARQTQGRQTMNALHSFFPPEPDPGMEDDAPGIGPDGP